MDASQTYINYLYISPYEEKVIILNIKLLIYLVDAMLHGIASGGAPTSGSTGLGSTTSFKGTGTPAAFVKAMPSSTIGGSAIVDNDEPSTPFFPHEFSWSG